MIITKLPNGTAFLEVEVKGDMELSYLDLVMNEHEKIELCGRKVVVKESSHDQLKKHYFMTGVVNLRKEWLVMIKCLISYESQN